jgi:uncharacterized protein (TIGR03435 family)
MRPKLRLPYSVYRLFLSAFVLSYLYAASAQTPPSPSFEVASIRPAPPQTDPNTGHWNYPGTGRFNATHLPLTMLIQLAYDVDGSQIANKPGWLDTSLYDIDAKAEAGVPLTRDELKPRLQDLLRERFHLVVHIESRSLHGYALVAAKGGAHLVPTKAEHFPGYRAGDVRAGQMRGANWSMAQLAKYLTAPAGFPVVDETGIAGSYDIGFSFNPKPEDTSSNLPALGEALKEATGLMLKEQRVPVETIVIDSVDKVPTEN